MSSKALISKKDIFVALYRCILGPKVQDEEQPSFHGFPFQKRLKERICSLVHTNVLVSNKTWFLQELAVKGNRVKKVKNQPGKSD